MREEIWNQKKDLPRLASLLRKSNSEILDPRTLVFAGSGDSYAASIFAEELSEGQAIASDPYELMRHIERIRKRTLVIVSISGRTRANVQLARKARRFAKKTIAITANNQSPLAQTCDQTIPLTYRNSGILTSGTISFTSSLIACAFLVGKLPKTVNASRDLERSARWANSARLGSGSLLLVGSGIDYALSMYGAAKIREVLGIKAEAEYPEQLGHARLFTIDKDKDTIVCISPGRDRAMQLGKILSRNGFRTNLLNVSRQGGLSSGLEAAIHLQQLALGQARKRGMNECAFLSDRRRLMLSNRLIY